MSLSIKRDATPKAKEEVKVDKEAKVKADAVVDATAPAYAPDILGSKSATIAFVSPLGDPSRPDTTTTKEADGSTKKTVTSYIVGFRFKALEDMEVPDCGLAEDARKNLMSYNAEKVNNKKLVKAGETFDLTRFETGMLLAPPEFNGRISGEGKSFTTIFQRKEVRSSKGTLGETSSATEIPTVSLTPDGAGSIKDYAIIDVLSFESIKEENGVTRKKRTIIPGFEKWEPLCITHASKAKKSATTSNKNKRNMGAEAFLQIVAKK